MNVTQSTVKGTFIIIKVILWSFPVLSISVEPRGNDILFLHLKNKLALSNQLSYFIKKSVVYEKGVNPTSLDNFKTLLIL
jgi:hypothetical protein